MRLLAKKALVAAVITLALSVPLAAQPTGPTLTGGTLPAAVVGTPYSQTLTPSGGTLPDQWVANGNLPNGLSFLNGVISGTPSSGSFAPPYYDPPAWTVNSSGGATSVTSFCPLVVTVTDSSTPSPQSASALFQVPSTPSSPCSSFTYAQTSFSGSWTFQNTAAASGTFSFHWHYTGFHAYFAVTAQLQVFSGSNTVTLYSAGPVNCCSSPSGGFDIQGDSSIAVTQGVPFGFITSGSNGDSNDTLDGTLVITNASIPAPTPTTTALSSSLNPSTLGQSVTLTARVTNIDATGTVTFFDSATNLGSGTLSNGATTLTTSGLAVGSHSLTAVYGGDGSHAGSASGVVTQVVNQAPTATSSQSSVNPSTFGQSVTFTAGVTAGATGTVTFKDGTNTLGTGTLNNGTATYSTAALSVATHSITAVYAGDSNYLTSTSSAVSQVVNKASTTTTLSPSVNPSTYGQSVTFTASVTGAGASGSVTFKDGTTTLGSGTVTSGSATYTTSALLAATHSITAVYSGDGSYLTSTSSALSQVVNQASTTTTVTPSVNPSTFGQSVTFTASVTGPGASGSVTFKDGTTTLGSGTLTSGNATYTTSALSVTTHSITAVYGGDSNYLTSTSSATNQVVNKASTTTTVTPSVNPSTYGQSVTFTAAVIGAGASGTVTFLDGTTTLGSSPLTTGSATYTTSALLAATHSITAVYSGDGSYLTSTSAAVSQVVNQASTSTTVTSTVNPSTFAQSVTFTASVTGAGASGSVTFKDGTTTLGSGTLISGNATYTTSALSVATHSITAVYSGDSNYLTSTSSALSQVVNQTSTTTTLTSSLNPSTFGQSVTFTASVTGAGTGPSGTVTFKDGTTTLGTGTLVSGSTTFSSVALAVATHSVTAVYGGDSSYLTSTSSPVSQVVNQAPTTTALISSLNPSNFGQSVTLTATVTQGTGTQVPGGTVTFLDGTTSLGTGSMTAGAATFTTSALTAGVHSLTASYGADTNDAASVSAAVSQNVKALTTVTLSSSVNPSVFGSSLTITATLTPSNATGTVTFEDGTGILGVAAISSGKAVFATKLLGSGVRALGAHYSGSGTLATSNATLFSQTVKTLPQKGFLAEADYSAGTQPGGSVIGDFNADGFADVATANAGGANISVLAGLGNGTFGTAVNYATSANPLAIITGDFNGDGKVDLAVAGTGINILLGNGDGTFRQAVLYQAGFGSLSSLSVADFNGDGIADLVAAGPGGDSNFVNVLLGNSDGTFRPPQSYFVPGSPRSIVTADFNGDGKADMATGTSQGTLNILLGNGDGTFLTPSVVAAGQSISSLVAGDFNSDGFADLAATDSAGNNALILLGKGDGTFQTAVAYAAGASPSAVAIGDFNSDAKSDLAISAGGGIVLLTGNGDGTFQAATTQTMNAVPGALLVGDFNGDGRSDIAATSSSGGKILVLPGAIPQPTVGCQAPTGPLVTGTAYSQTCPATGGIGSYTWSISAGALPAGLSLNPATGVISGTPTAIGASQFTISATDSDTPPQTGTLSLSLTSATPLSVTGGALAAGTQGIPYTSAAVAVGGTPPISCFFSAGTPPPGLSVNPTTCVIAGTPTLAGSYTFDVGASDRGLPPQATSQTFTLTIAYPALAIPTTSLPPGVAGTAYGPVTLSATGGSGKYTWSATGLPTGISISTDGVLSGTPTSLSTSATITVTDVTASATLSKTLTLTVTALPLQLTGPASLGSVTVGGAVSGTYTVKGGLPPYIWALAAGPPGVSVDSKGVLSGSISQAGVYGFSVQVTDSLSTSATLTVSASAFGILTTQLPPASTLTPYSATITTSGGAAPITFSASGVPDGMTFTAGSFSGQALNPGSSTISVTATDAKGLTASASYPLTITGPGPLAIPNTSLPDGTVGLAYSQSVTATGGTPPYSWTQTGGALPNGFSITPAGVVSGLASTPGTSSFGVKVTDKNGSTKLASISLNIQPAPLVITNGSSLPNGIALVEYPGQILSATGGTQPYNFTITGTLPTGLFLSGGQVGGTPQAAGTYGFTIVVTDSATPQLRGTLATQITVKPNSPDLVLSTTSASFALTSGSTALPPSNLVSVHSSVATQFLSYTTSISPSASWLSATGGGTTPSSLSLGLTSSALKLTSAGSPYSTSVVLTCTATPCLGNTQSISVSLVVTDLPPLLSSSPSLLAFSALATTPQATTSQITIQNQGGGSLQILSVTAADSWLSVGSFPASVPAGPGALVNVTADPTGLPAQFYRSTITITTSAGNATIPVTLLVAPSASMTLGPNGTQFTMPQGSILGNPNGSFLVTVSTPASVAYSASILPGANWLTLGAGNGNASGTNNGSVTFSVNQTAASALDVGPYYATIRVTAPGLVNSPQDFQVVLNITPTTKSVAVDPEPAGLIFQSSGTAAIPDQNIQVFASSKAPLIWQASATGDSGTWLSITPTTGTTVAGTPGQVVVSAKATGLAPGVYRGLVTFATAGAAVRAVNVTLNVQGSSSGSSSSIITQSMGAGTQAAGRVTPEASSCAGVQLVPTQTGLTSSFSAPASWPTPLAVVLVDNCGAAIGAGQVVTTFSNGDPPIILSPVDASRGLYSATWTPRKSSAQVTISARATAPGYSTASIQIGGQVVPNAAPVLSPNGTSDIFNPQVGAGLGPGNIVQIYGSNLANQPASPTTLPLPTSVTGTSVLIGGVQAPLYYVSPTQINAQIPFELTAGNQYQVIVSANGALTTPQPIQLNGGTPAVLQFTSGAVVAQHADGSLILDSSPAAPGEYVVMYLTGLGATDQNVPSGGASPSSPLANVVNVPTLTLNANPVPLAFAGLTPGLVGLYQINFQVPKGLASGSYPLSLNQGGTVSNTAALPVAAQ